MKLSRSSLGLLAAGFLTGAVALAQTSAPQQSYPASPSAGAGASVQSTAPQGTSGQAGVSATTPSGQAGASASTPQTSTPQTSQPPSSAPQSSQPQSSTTYTTTTQTTVPQSSQPGTPQTGAAGSTAYPSGQPGSSVPGAVAPAGQPETLIDPGKIYNDKQPTSWVGKPVVLQNVMIQDTNDSGNFWVGSDGHHRLLIVKPEGNATLKSMRFHKGDVVTVSGTVQPASRYMAKQTSESGGDMHDAEKSSGVILLADNITVSSSTHK